MYPTRPVSANAAPNRLLSLVACALFGVTGVTGCNGDGNGAGDSDATGDYDGIGDTAAGDTDLGPPIPMNHWDDICPLDGVFIADRDCAEDELDPATMAGLSELFAGLPLIHDQVFIIPENAEIGDTAGQLNLMWVDDGQAVTYSLSDDDGGRFSIDAQAVISIAAADFDYDTAFHHLVTARATETGSGDWDEATIVFKVVPVERTTFIDPTWTGTDSGTREEPLVTLADAEPYLPDRAYLLKRGTVDVDGLFIHEGGTAEAPVIFAAYGTGPRPRISRASDLYCVHLGSMAPFLVARYVDIHSLEFDTCLGLRTVPNSHHLSFNDMEIRDLEEDGGIFFNHNQDGDPGSAEQLLHGRLTDIHAHHHHTGDGIQCEGGGVVARNLHLHDNWGHGISVPYWSYGNDVRYVRSYRNDVGAYDGSGIEIGANETVFSFSRTSRNAIGVLINDGSTGARVRNVITDDNLEHGISIHERADDIIIENSECYLNYHGVRARQSSSNVVIRYNKIHHNLHHGVALYRTDLLGGPSAITAYYNLIYDNVDEGLRLFEAEDVEIFNNTFYSNGGIADIVVETAMSALVIRNNLLAIGIGGAENGSADASHNRTHTNDDFVDSAARDLHLVDGSPNVDAGTDVGLDRDFEGNSVPNGDGPDVGAYEF